MREVYRSSSYAPEKISKQYVAYHPWHETFRTFEVDAKSKTIREYDSDGSEYPSSFRDVVMGRSGQSFSAVEWVRGE